MAAMRMYNGCIRLPREPYREIQGVRVLPFAYHAQSYQLTLKYRDDQFSNIIHTNETIIVLLIESQYQPGPDGRIRRTGDDAPARTSTHPPARSVRLDQAETEPIPTSRLPRRTGA